MHTIMYKTIFVVNIIIYMRLQHSDVLWVKNCGLSIFKGNNLLPKRICSFKHFELDLKEFAPLRIFCKFVFT